MLYTQKRHVVQQANPALLACMIRMLFDISLMINERNVSIITCNKCNDVSNNDLQWIQVILAVEGKV